MNVIKFGGGVLKTSINIKQAFKLTALYKKAVIVVSAFGKMTNAFEQLAQAFVMHQNTKPHLIIIQNFHYGLIANLFSPKDRKIAQVELIFSQLNAYLEKKEIQNFDFEYDQIVPFGELLSSAICNEYFFSQGLNCHLIDARTQIATNSIFRDATINWDKTKKNISKNLTFNNYKFYVTQGFIGADEKGNTTTLGREGSDFSASIFAYCLNAKQVDFWKEVKGIYNCDPSKNKNFILLPRLSYREAVEQIYFGAKILHPKTIKPLQNKKITVKVRPFSNPAASGTVIFDISRFEKDYFPTEVIYIEKENQLLISFSPRNFSFIDEENLGKIFSLLAKYRIKANLMENSALKFSICVDNIPPRITPFLAEIKNSFEILSNENLKLITIRHYTQAAIKHKTANKKVYISQKSRRTARFVCGEISV